jgi:cyclohexa-1,5-dienecarbonyl-CoA hydratase
MIDVTRNERVVHLAINAPPVNVLDSAVLAELSERLKQHGADDSVAAILIEGAGRCFSAGASVAEHKPDPAEAMLDGLIDACTIIADQPVPVVAMVHGACLGGAMELIAFCDFVVADPEASLGQPEVKLAFFPPVACYQLPRLGGLQNAAFTALTGESLSAERAAAMGFVQQLLAKDDWGQIDKIFNRLSVPVLRLTKQALRAGGGAYDRQALEEIKRLFLDRLYQLEDVAEGIKSFEERRKPVWTHRS